MLGSRARPGGVPGGLEASWGRLDGLVGALGGVLGGAFNALLVPLIFNSVIEYPLLLVAALLLRPEARWIGRGRTRVWAIAACAALLGAIVLRLVQGGEEQSVRTYRTLLALAVIAMVMGRQSKAAPAIAAVCAFGIGYAAHPVAGGVAERGFFGVVKVISINTFFSWSISIL